MFWTRIKMFYWNFRRISVALALLSYFQNGVSCDRVKWEPGDVRVEEQMLNDLPANQRIASLSHIIETNFPKYEQVQSVRLTYVTYKKEGERPHKKEVAENSYFMRCGKFIYHLPWSYVCIGEDHGEWNVFTNKRDTEESKTCDCPKNVEEMELTFRVTGRKESGETSSDIFLLHLKMLPRCMYEEQIYRNLSVSCIWMTNYTQLSRSSLRSHFVFRIPETNWQRTIKIEGLITSEDAPKDNFMVDLYCDDVFLTSCFINSSKRYYAVNKVCNGPAKTVKLKPQWNNTGVVLLEKSIIMGYYVMEDFCNKKCVGKYSKWINIIDPMPRRCVADKLQLATAFRECDVKYNLTLSSSSEEPLIGGNLTLKCEPTSIILQYRANWERIGHRGEPTKSWLTDTEFYTISNLSYADEAEYQCYLLTDGGKFQTKSNRFRLKLHNVFIGQVLFHFPIKELNASDVGDLKFDIERNITKALIAKDIKQPLFSIDVDKGLTVNGKAISVSGTLKSLKTDSLASYVRWMQDIKDVVTEVFKAVDVRILNEGGCNSVAEDWDSLGVTYIWPIAASGTVEQQPCPFNEEHFTYKRCLPGEGENPAHYAPTNHTACSDVDSTLAELVELHITKDNAESTSQELYNVMSRGTNITGRQLTVVTDTLVRLKDLENTTGNVLDKVMSTIDHVMELDQDVLTSSEIEGQSTTRIIELLGDIAENLTSSTPYTVSKKNFALQGIRKSVNDFEGISINVIYSTSGVSMSTENYENYKDVGTANISKIVVRKDAKEQIPSSTKNVTFVTISYKDDRLFVKSINATPINFAVNSHVISTEIRGHMIKNLPSAVTLTFSLQNASIMGHDKMCTFWNFATNNWSGDGCRVAGIDDISKTVTCTCDHMTNFAVMFSAIPPEGIHAIVLSYTTYIGLSISLAGVFLTLLTFMLFPMLRTSTPPKILMNLCVALIGMYTVFFISAGTPAGTSGCKAVSVFLQYFFLAVFSWSAIEGFHSSRCIVTPMKVEINSFLQKALLFGWGAPVLITSIGAGVWSDHYGSKDFCVVRKHPFVYTILIPILVVIVFNITCVSAIGVVLMFSSKKHKSSSMSMRNRVRILAGFVVLFGITWILGFFVVSNDIVAFQYAFCLMSCVQGIYMFILYGIKKGKQRRCWHKLLSGKSIAEIHRHFLLKAQSGSQRRGSGGAITRGMSTTSGGMGTSSTQLMHSSSSCSEKKLSNSRDLLTSRDLLDEVKKGAASTIRIELKRKPVSESIELSTDCPIEPSLHRGESLVGTIVRKFEEMRQKSMSSERVNRPLLQRGARSVDWDDDSRDTSSDFAPGAAETRSSSNDTNDSDGNVFPEPISFVDCRKTELSSNSDSTQGLLGARGSSIDTDDEITVTQTPASPVERSRTKLLQRQRHFSEV